MAGVVGSTTVEQKYCSTGVCGDVVHVSHFSSHALVEIKTSRQDWTGRLNFTKSSTKEKGTTLSVLRCGIKDVFPQRNHDRLSQSESLWKVESLKEERDLIQRHLPEKYRLIASVLYWSGRVTEVLSIRVRNLVPDRGMVVLELENNQNQDHTGGLPARRTHEQTSVEGSHPEPATL